MTQAKAFNLKYLPSLVPFNVDWSTYFGNELPVDLEIGCGRPHFFFDRALHHPERNIVGVEWKYEFMAQAQRRIGREGIKNAAAFHGNAWLLVPLLFKENSLSQVFVNFPDPWWKVRHKKRLVLNDVFLDALKRCMVKEGTILLQTDVLELFEFYCSIIHEHGGFKLDTNSTQEAITSETKAQTHREKKCLEQNMPIYRGLFRRV